MSTALVITCPKCDGRGTVLYASGPNDELECDHCDGARTVTPTCSQCRERCTTDAIELERTTGSNYWLCDAGCVRDYAEYTERRYLEVRDSSDACHFYRVLMDDAAACLRAVLRAEYEAIVALRRAVAS
jgi:hypothetical protein